MSSMRRQQLEATCSSLLNELQLIWDEVGEPEEERDQMLLEVEQERMKAYRRKVDQANRSRAWMHQMLADIHSEIVALASALGDRPPMAQLEKRGFSLKEQLAQLKPLLEDLKRKREERKRQFGEIRAQIQKIQQEISSQGMETPIGNAVPLVEQDLSQGKLDELQAELYDLQKEKNDRLHKVMEHINTIHDLCAVLGWDFLKTIREVHPSLDESLSNQGKSVSSETILSLNSTIESLREEKRRRMQQVQDLGASLLELWNLMDSPVEEQHQFQHVTCNIAAAEDEVVAAGALSQVVIEQAEAEVERLEQLKSSKLKELVLKKFCELEEICRKAHMVPDGNTTLDTTLASLESGMVDPAALLATIEQQIGTAKEEAFSRKEIMEKIEKWMSACEEESWLEEYNKDENRYNATRGAHLNLKRAERARATVNRIPVLVDALVSKAKAWEEERGKPLIYDGGRLLLTIEEYKIQRMEKEEERKKLRDQRRLQSINEQESLSGVRPNSNSRTPLKKTVQTSRPNGTSVPSSRRLSLGGAVLLQETPAVSRLNGTTPGRLGMPAAFKDIRSIKTTSTPTTANRVLIEEDASLYPTGNDPSTNLSIPDTDASSTPRLPLSPVPTLIAKPNTNVVEEVNSKGGHVPSTPVKVVLNSMKNSLPATPLGRPTAETPLDEQNDTPHKQIDTPVSASGLSRSTKEVPGCEENGPPYKESITLKASSQKQQHNESQFQPAQEYSFEERRLAFIFQHDSQISAWTDCR